MVKALSSDLRDRLLDAVKNGMSCRAAAARFGVSPSTAIRRVTHFRQTGSRQPKRQGGDLRSHHIEAHSDFILGLIDEDKNITLAEIVQQLENRLDFTTAQSTVWRFFSRRGISYKGYWRIPSNRTKPPS
jgi:transposase